MSRTDNDIHVSNHDAARGSQRSYTIGFLLSLAFTLTAYVVVQMYASHRSLSHLLVMVSIFCLALGQLAVQLICFLHLGKESRPRWNLTIMAFAILVVVVVVGGSLWIMYNLNYRMTPANKVNSYMQSQDGL